MELSDAINATVLLLDGVEVDAGRGRPPRHARVIMSTQVCLVRQDGTVVKEWVAQRRAATRHPMPPFPDKINLHLSKDSYHNVGASAAGEAHAVDNEARATAHAKDT